MNKILTFASSSADCWRRGVLKEYDPTVATISVMVPTLARTFFWRSAAFCSDPNILMFQQLTINNTMQADCLNSKLTKITNNGHKFILGRISQPSENLLS